MVRFVRAVLLALVVALGASAQLASAQDWRFVRGNPSGDGFINVATAPALQAERIVPRLGGVYAGVSPVIASDGSVYIAARRELIALTAGGELRWLRPVVGGEALASPVIDRQGAVYLASTQTAANAPRSSTLTKYDAGGHVLWRIELPVLAPGHPSRGRVASRRDHSPRSVRTRKAGLRPRPDTLKIGNVSKIGPKQSFARRVYLLKAIAAI